MPTLRETILAALPATALRGDVLPERVPGRGPADPVEGAASLKAAMIPVVLHYFTADPLG